MCRELVHIYGPISICGYGLMIFIGVILFAYLVNRDPGRSKIMSGEQFMDILTFGTFVGLIGGRLLFILTNIDAFNNWYEMAAVWDGGLSIMGSMVALLLVLPWYLAYNKIPMLPFFDLIAIYTPLLEAISRIGCFCAGCCYGTVTSMPWGISFQDIQADSTITTCIHPTQLYSAALLFLIFIIMRYGMRRFAKKPGQLILIFLVLASSERFAIDFWRADREFFTWDHVKYLSIHQYIACGLAFFSVIGLIIISRKSRQKQHESL